MAEDRQQLWSATFTGSQVVERLKMKPMLLTTAIIIRENGVHLAEAEARFIKRVRIDKEFFSAYELSDTLEVEGKKEICLQTDGYKALCSVLESTLPSETVRLTLKAPVKELDIEIQGTDTTRFAVPMRHLWPSNFPEGPPVWRQYEAVGIVNDYPRLLLRLAAVSGNVEVTAKDGEMVLLTRCAQATCATFLSTPGTPPKDVAPQTVDAQMLVHCSPPSEYPHKLPVCPPGAVSISPDLPLKVTYLDGAVTCFLSTVPTHAKGKPQH
ncbi:hypothetical protein DIPPA_21907 [Diplonema papillatum]|nr:hypothetical protein DIPPA_21907 [Diplonema papillatum]